VSAARVHESAVVEPGAQLGRDVVVGAHCFVGSRATLGDGCRLWPQSAVFGPSRLGARNELFPRACIGAPPQDRSYRGEDSVLLVGDDNVFREHTTVHRGTAKGGGVTTIGSRCLLMVDAHVAHDCTLGDDVTLTNRVSLGGHVQVDSGAVVGGHVAIAPFVRIGRLAFVAGGAMVEQDVPPFTIAAGDRARVRGINRVGLRRAAIDDDEIRALEQAYLHVWRSCEPRSSALQSLPEHLARRDLVRQMTCDLGRDGPQERRYLVSISRSNAASTSS